MHDNAFYVKHIADQFKDSSDCEKHRDLLDDYYIAKNTRQDARVKMILMACVDPDRTLNISDDLFDLAVKDIKKVWDERIPPATDKDLENVSKINKIIEGQDSYGHQEWKKDGKGVVAMWSNGSELWYLDRLHTELLKKKQSLSLDANEIIAPVNEKEFLRIHRRLAPLPLFFGSTEAKERKIVDWDTADDVWLYGQIKRLTREQGKNK